MVTHKWPCRCKTHTLFSNIWWVHFNTRCGKVTLDNFFVHNDDAQNSKKVMKLNSLTENSIYQWTSLHSLWHLPCIFMSKQNRGKYQNKCGKEHNYISTMNFFPQWYEMEHLLRKWLILLSLLLRFVTYIYQTIASKLLHSCTIIITYINISFQCDYCTYSKISNIKNIKL